MFQRDLATNAIIEFLQDESNRNTRDRLKLMFQRDPELDQNLAVRCMVLGQFGVIPLEPGARLGLMVRFVELGVSLVDWDRVIGELGLDPKLNKQESSS